MPAKMPGVVNAEAGVSPVNANSRVKSRSARGYSVDVATSCEGDEAVETRTSWMLASVMGPIQPPGADGRQAR